MFGRRKESPTESWGPTRDTQPCTEEVCRKRTPYGDRCEECRKNAAERLDARAIAEAKEERRKRDDRRAALGVSTARFDAMQPCPKCGEHVKRPDYVEGYRTGAYWTLANISGNGQPGGCAVRRGCPEGEHLHVKCPCGWWYAALCADAEREPEQSPPNT